MRPGDQSRLSSSDMAHQILILEDNARDRQLLEETLAGGDFSFRITHAQTKAEFQSALEKNEFDVVISDYDLPSYNGIAALAFSKKIRPQTPFILISGSIGEEIAVESLKLGATDYILKDRLARLGQAVERALQETRERREHEREAAKRKALEEQLQQSHKMEAIGQLAGGIAHDFNNMLLVIHGNAELVLQKENQLSQSSIDSIKQITSAATRGANLIRQLLAFSCKQVIQFQPFNLNQAVRSLLKMLDRIIGEDISVQCHLAEDLPPIRADIGMINQVLINLIINARDAMPGGGSLLLATAMIDIDDAKDHPNGRPGKFVCLTVKDTGTGIPPEILPRIFEPFFTTKEVGKGTGLGLAMVYGIAQQHEGWAEVETRPGEGAAFKIFLPANVLPEDGAKPPAPEKVSGGEKILVVEDDADARKFVRTVLEDSGYEIHEAANGKEALEVWNARGKQFHLLITDIIMPGALSGAQLATRLRMDRSELKVIFMSGYASNVAGKIQPHEHFLQKPYTVEELQKTVRLCIHK